MFVLCERSKCYILNCSGDTSLFICFSRWEEGYFLYFHHTNLTTICSNGNIFSYSKWMKMTITTIITNGSWTLLAKISEEENFYLKQPCSSHCLWKRQHETCRQALVADDWRNFLDQKRANNVMNIEVIKYITADQTSVWDLAKISFQVMWAFSELISQCIYQRLTT